MANEGRATADGESGFTLVELLVVIGIIAVLVALLMPAVQGARESARRTECLNKMKQLGLGVLGYEASNGMLPPGGTMRGDSGTSCNFNGGSWSKDGGPLWSVHILPFMEDKNRYDKYDLTQAFAVCTNYGSTCFNFPVQFQPNPRLADHGPFARGRRPLPDRRPRPRASR
jgi:prepilin-type N-terminal cleavage/methylation domain-containing protein